MFTWERIRCLKQDFSCNNRATIVVIIAGTILLLGVYTVMQTNLDIGARIFPTRKQLLYVNKRFIDRKNKLQRVCSEGRTNTARAIIITGYRPAHLSVCIVHKAASTVWLRLLKLLINEDKHDVLPPSNTKWRLHHENAKTYENFDIYGTQKMTVMRTTKILTARNPYIRLWSAYVDKFLLLEFSHDLGREIIKRYRPGATTKAEACGHDVTFEEFIRFVIGKGHGLGLHSTHWLPVSDICDPCEYKPDYIVKQETLRADLEATLKYLGLSITVRDVLSNKQDEAIMKDELDDHFIKFKNLPVKNCVTEEEFLYRVWQGLIVNGYIPPGDLPDKFRNGPMNSSMIKDLVVTLRQRHGVNDHVARDLRQHALVQAYQQIPKHDLMALQDLYKLDFEMFGYDRAPPG